jgi:hypothetical protein
MGVIQMSELKKMPSFRKRTTPLPDWRGERCFIVGGGESVKDFDFSKLEGEKVIVVNRTLEYIPNADIFFFQDIRLWGWYESGDLGEQAKRVFDNFKGLAVCLNKEKFPVPDVHNIPTIDYKGEDFDVDGLPSTNNSGLGAICLATALGANPIYLLGFDCQGNTKNFHIGYPQQEKEGLEKEFIKDFNRVGPYLNKRTTILNLNPNSGIDIFKKAEFPNLPDKESVYIEGYLGIGDCFWERPFIKDLSRRYKIYLRTFAPQVFWDIPDIEFVHPKQDKFKSHTCNAKQFNGWVERPNIRQLPIPHYWIGFRADISITEAFQVAFKTTNYNFNFPVKEEWIKKAKRLTRETKKKICVIHFPTERDEWKCPARDPKPEYLQMLVDKYKDEYYFISLADLRTERFRTEPKNIDRKLHYGELSLEEIFGLVKLADMTITGNCYLLPISLAIGTKTFAIWGGCQKPELFIDKRMIKNNLEIAAPEPVCNCLEPNHKDCNKEIPEEQIVEKFEKLKNYKPNLLLCRMTPKNDLALLKNEYLTKKYNIHILAEPHQKYDFKVHYFNGREIPNSIKQIKFDKAIISQKLFPLSDKVAEFIKNQGGKVVWAEAFFDKRLRFDTVGLDYCPENEIKLYAKETNPEKIKYPKKTRTAQPKDITQKEMYQKYGLSGKNYIVILGQAVFDMSLKYSKNPDIKTFYDYIKALAENNPETQFLFKPHPNYKTEWKNRIHEMDFIEEYKNIKTIDESLKTLFRSFTLFTAFSSTTIFEGLRLRKKFATVGYHFCDNDKLVYQLKDKESFKDLYKKLSKFKIDEELRRKYMTFICNKYTIPTDSSRIVDKLELTKEEFYALR